MATYPVKLGLTVFLSMILRWNASSFPADCTFVEVPGCEFLNLVSLVQFFVEVMSASRNHLDQFSRERFHEPVPIIVGNTKLFILSTGALHSHWENP
jgi:hypothetical protein